MRSNLVILLRNTNVMPFRWVSNNYECFFCAGRSKYYTDIEELRQHTVKEHSHSHTPEIMRRTIRFPKQIKIDITFLSCKICSSSFQTLNELTEHLVEKHRKNYQKGTERYLFQAKLGAEKLKCLECDEEFNYFQHLVIHSTKMHETKIFLCGTCGKGFEFYHKFKNHLQMSHMDDIKCEMCEKRFTNHTNRRAHMARLHNVGGWTCKECGVTFDTFNKRRKHALLKHDKGSRYTCDACSITFAYRRNYLRHNRAVHENVKVKCPICSAMVRYLDDHMTCHNDEKPFACDVCQKTFARKKNMAAHKKTHKKVGA